MIAFLGGLGLALLLIALAVGGAATIALYAWVAVQRRRALARARRWICTARSADDAIVVWMAIPRDVTFLKLAAPILIPVRQAFADQPTLRVPDDETAAMYGGWSVTNL